MGLFRDMYDAEVNGWSLSSEQANKRNIERGRLHHRAEMELLKQREVEALKRIDEIRSLLRDIRDQGTRSEERATRNSRNVAYMVGHPAKS